MLQLAMDSSEGAAQVHCTVAIFDSHDQLAATHVLTFAAVQKRNSIPGSSSSSPHISPASSPIHEEPIHEEPIHEEPIHEEPIHEEPVVNDSSKNSTAEERICIEECGRYNVPCLIRRGCPTGVVKLVGGVTGGLSGVAASVMLLPPCTGRTEVHVLCMTCIQVYHNVAI
jgi:hypothetical protein